MHSEYKHIGRGLAESAASVLKGETLNEELYDFKNSSPRLILEQDAIKNNKITR